MNKLLTISFTLLISLSLSVYSQQSEEMDSGASSKPAVSKTVEEVQEIKYVTDKLRLSLYKQADSSSGTIKLLVSGDKLEVLERSGPYSRVRTVQKEIGWVKNGFLVSTPTASNLLQDREQQIEKLKAQLDKFSDSKNLAQQYETRQKQLIQEKQSLAQQLGETQERVETLNQKNDELSQTIEQLTSSEDGIDLATIEKILFHYWYFLVAIVLIVFVVGLFIGRKIIEAEVNRRFQGVKVI